MANKQMPWKGQATSIVIPLEIYEWLETKASVWYCSRVQAIRIVLGEAMKRDKEANPDG